VPADRLVVLLCLGLLGLAVAARTASAHGFGQRYDLPVPLTLWVAGAAVAVALSFVVIGVFVRRAPGARGYPRLNLLRWRPGRLLVHERLRDGIGLLSIAGLALILLASILGSQNPTLNLAPTAVWVFWWVGLAYVSALVGNVWAVLNPWSAAFGWVERWQKPDPDDGVPAMYRRYPAWLGTWPGCILFLAFAWAELVFPGRALPANLGLMIVVYSLVAFAGMGLFGRAAWLRHGDPFALAFGVLARFSPTEVRVTAPAVCRQCPVVCRDRDGECIDCYDCFARAPAGARELNLRPFASGLLRNETISASMAAFVVLLLATVTFDGFTATPAWAEVESALYAALPELGGARLMVVGTLGLLAFPALFYVVYRLFSGWIATMAGGRIGVRDVGTAFVLSLVPIAIGYHLAHYFTYLLIQGQLAIGLVSDPFGFGWNLFGTAGWRPDIAIVGARFAWYTAVTAIVVGHIVAVWVAHVIALQRFDGRDAAVRSQYPMLVLMVGYTMLSLWIVAQPIVESSPGA
jgi:polyferredoxin